MAVHAPPSECKMRPLDRLPETDVPTAKQSPREGQAEPRRPTDLPTAMRTKDQFLPFHCHRRGT
jgi:hypothetical protein